MYWPDKIYDGPISGEEVPQSGSLKIIDQILKGETPKPGSYTGRLNTEPENNRKTLMDIKNA